VTVTKIISGGQTGADRAALGFAVSEAAKVIQTWIERREIKVLNVAGPRASKDSEIYRVMMELLETTPGETNRP
jgi:hypothetical protein